jgi:hypothetical protein
MRFDASDHQLQLGMLFLPDQAPPRMRDMYGARVRCLDNYDADRTLTAVITKIEPSKVSAFR